MVQHQALQPCQLLLHVVRHAARQRQLVVAEQQHTQLWQLSANCGNAVPAADKVVCQVQLGQVWRSLSKRTWAALQGRQARSKDACRHGADGAGVELH